jgi:hypothetical protein
MQCRLYDVFVSCITSTNRVLTLRFGDKRFILTKELTEMFLPKIGTAYAEETARGSEVRRL